MNQLSIKQLEECIEESFYSKNMLFMVDKKTQKEVKDDMKVLGENFQMIAFENTDLNPMNVGINESNFLNGPSYNGCWLSIELGETVAYVCVSLEENEIIIDAIEVNSLYRGDGFGRLIVEGIENFAYDYHFSYIRVHPFDDSAADFWQHMGYNWASGYSLVKSIQ